MPNWNEAEYTQRAQEIAKLHVQSRKSLNDLSEKAARDESLNPEEIRTLVRLANVATFQEIFKNKADGDKMVEFDVGQPEEVIRRIVSGDTMEPQTANIHNDKLAYELPDQMSAVRGGLRSIEMGEEKVASAVEDEPVRAGRKDMAVLQLRKLASEFEVEKMRLGYVWEMKLAELTSEFRKLYGPKYDEFEKDAYADYGMDVLPEVVTLREGLRLPLTKPDEEKVAHLTTHRVTEQSPTHDLLKIAVESRVQYVKYEKGLAWINEQLKKLEV